ncbi:IS30 family transposase [Shewanella sp. 0m-8]
MGQQYNHLTEWERKRLFEWYHYQKKSMREIGRLLDRSHSTISREIDRNMSTHYVPTYYPNPAHRAYKSRMRRRVTRERLKCSETRNYVVNKLRIGWTPELISGRLKLKSEAPYACHESIYQFIYHQAPELISHLPRKHKRRRKKYPARKYVRKATLKTSILERPIEVDNRTEVGHWESDSVESKGRKLALNVLVERVSRLAHITKLSSKKAIVTKNAIIKKLSEHPPGLVNSITYDNGVENAHHLVVNEYLDCKSYFCQPYHSWEKGAVEQINGLIRRYLPKGTDFETITENQILKIENALNSRPRKCLNYKTPFETYTEMSGALLL